MATNKLALLLISGLLASLAHTAGAREAVTSVACKAAAQTASISKASGAAENRPDDLQLKFALADAWSEAGCFDDAVRVLTEATQQKPGSKEAATRLRVARSVVGEEHFFDKLDQADDEARLKRDVFRCSTLSDVEACQEAVKLKPADPETLSSLGDALMKANRGKEAVAAYQLAAAKSDNPHALDAKIAAVQPPRSIAEPAAPATSVPDRSAAQARIRTARATAPIEPRPVPREQTTSAPLPRFSNLEPDSESH